MTLMHLFTDMVPANMAVLANLDINGFLTSQSFLTQLASAISAFLLSLFSIFLGGGTATTG
ncbi:MAG TPA: hypothetical protein PKN33_10660 [Phycisphaerae bacterium]|nr:hypothetical protein [Phycisphaerales bacterium]HNO78510.1 hypothetical protein [Phycisphaerae bacterium]